MKWQEIPPNPARLLHAIGSIGYDPEVALCDIIDNSLDAGASQVVLLLNADEEDADTIASYIVVDDGDGMDEAALLNAFKIGSDRFYSERSLGKFGIGLKSAALSLGDRLILVTKQTAASKPLCAILSVVSVRDSGSYAVQIGYPPADAAALWAKHAPNPQHGTLVMIAELNDSQPNHGHFLKYVRRFCSITFHMFLDGPDARLKMSVNGQVLEALDPLFTAEADANGPMVPPADWTGRNPRRLLEPTAFELATGVAATIEATHLVHPPSFEEDKQREAVRERYLIGLDGYTETSRHGFYVYRNKRVIVMAERFRGVVPNQTASWAFRGRLMFDESADEILALDVRKRHCQLPKRARANLLALMRPYLLTSSNAWRDAGGREQRRKGSVREAIAEESLMGGPITELAYAPGSDVNDAAAVAARSEAQSRIEDVSRASIQDLKLSSTVLAKLVAGRHPVVMADSLKANAMWLPLPAVEAGFAQTLVNRNNGWVQAAYANAEQNASLYVTLHQIFTILGRAEIEVRSSKWAGLAQDAPDRVFDAFRRKASAIAEDLADPLAETLRRIGEGVIEEDLVEEGVVEAGVTDGRDEG